MRKRWFTVERVSTKENPADLNTKPLSRERREYLMKKIGLCSETFEDKPNNMANVKVKQIVRMVVAMVTAGNLQGCDGGTISWTSSMVATWMNPLAWTATAWWTLTTIVLMSVIWFLWKTLNELKDQVVLYKQQWEAIVHTMRIQTLQEEPVVHPDAREEPFSGVWYNQETSEEEERDEDMEVREEHAVERGLDVMGEMEALDQEEPPQPGRIFLTNGLHGAAPGDDGDGPDESPRRIAERAEEREGDGVITVPDVDEGIEIMTNAIGEIMDAAEGHGGSSVEVEVEVEVADDESEDWEEEETPENRFLRYVQSGMEEVSDPDEWADIHYGRTASTPSRSRSPTPASSPNDPNVPERRAMPKILAQQRDRRIASERAEEEAQIGEEERYRRGQPEVTPSAGSSSRRRRPMGDNINFFHDSMEIAEYYSIGLVPRDAAAFDDWRWDLIMQGVGPETILVNNSRELSRYIATCTDISQRAALQRLLRSLHSLMVMFQSGNPNLWIDAAFNLKGWLESGRGVKYFELGSTDGGATNEEGEEEENTDDDDEDRQDRILRERRDRDDGDRRDGDGGDRRVPGEGESSSSRPSAWDYDDAV